MAKMHRDCAKPLNERSRTDFTKMEPESTLERHGSSLNLAASVVHAESVEQDEEASAVGRESTCIGGEGREC